MNISTAVRLTAEQSFPLHHLPKGLCSKENLLEISSKDIVTDSKTISGANIVDTLMMNFGKSVAKILLQLIQRQYLVQISLILFCLHCCNSRSKIYINLNI